MAFWFFRDQPESDQDELLRIVHGVTRAGTVGVGIYRDEKLAAWGLSESAAFESLRVSDVA